MCFATALLSCAALLATATVGDQASATGFATYNAVVRAADGVTITGSGVSSSKRTALGAYEVTFGRDVTGCAFIGTSRGLTPGLVSANTKNGSPKVVVVRTFTHAGAKADLSFYLLVHCNS
jgi:hypothetical protein